MLVFDLRGSSAVQNDFYRRVPIAVLGARLPKREK